ncbi:MAG: ferric reductase-like transmembrane domain-containing protein [Pseudomonadales bacterium]
MTAGLLVALLLFGAALLPDRLPAAGFGWDALNGLGISALALLIALAWDAESPSRTVRLRLHQNLALGALVLVTAHSVGFLLFDPLLLEHLKPTAPVHMLIALAALLIIVILGITSFPGIRHRIYAGFRNFRRWHIALSLLALAGSLWHLLGIGSTFQGPWRTGVLVAGAALLPLVARLRRANGGHRGWSQPPADIRAADRHAIAATAAGLCLAVGYGLLKNL